jgi:hypothetical protein
VNIVEVLLLLFTLLLLQERGKTAKNPTPTPDARYTDYKLGCVGLCPDRLVKVLSCFIIIIIIIIVKSKTANPNAVIQTIGLCGCVGVTVQ